jgi:hypothetical protein
MRQLKKASRRGGRGSTYNLLVLVEMNPRGPETLAFTNMKLYKAAWHNKKYRNIINK